MTEEITQAAPSFSYQDLDNAVKVIDAACQRGAFRGEEMTSVGAVRDKLVNFLVASQPKEVADESTLENTSEAGES
jgi:hypothetical protein